MGGARHKAYEDAYLERLAELGLTNGGIPSPVYEEHYPLACAGVDERLDREEAELSLRIWEGPLAELAAELMAFVARPADPDSVITPQHFVNRYNDARHEVFRQQIAEQGLDLCRGCLELKPAGEILLVLVHEVKLEPVVKDSKPHSYYKLVRESCGYGYYCLSCRAVVHRHSERVTLSKGLRRRVQVFREVYEAADMGGLWVFVDGDWSRMFPHFSNELHAGDAGPARCPYGRDDEFGLPSRLSVELREVRIMRTSYLLGLLRREVVLPADSAVA